MSSKPTCLILDGDAGQSISFVRSLGRAGWTVICPEGTRAASSRCASEVVPLSDPLAAPDAFAAELAALFGSAGNGIDLVVPATDATLLLAHEAAARCGVRVVGGQRELLPLLLDKAETLRAAEIAGFPVPRWFDTETVQEVVDAANDLGYPCVVKPRRSYHRDGARLVQARHAVASGAESAREAAERMIATGHAPIVQAYVPGRHLAVTAVVSHGVVRVAIARETFSFYPPLGGTSVRRRTIEMGSPGVSEALDLLLALGVESLAEVEYQLDGSGSPRLMEIGPRSHGWVPLAVAAGVDLPLIASELALDREPSIVEGYRVGTELRWPAGELLRMRAAMSRSPVPYPMTRRSLMTSAWPPWRPGVRFDGIDLRDLQPALPRGVRRLHLRTKAPDEGEGSVRRRV